MEDEIKALREEVAALRREVALLRSQPLSIPQVGYQQNQPMPPFPANWPSNAPTSDYIPNRPNPKPDVTAVAVVIRRAGIMTAPAA